MTRLRDARGRWVTVALLAGSIALLAGCHTVGGTLNGMGQDIGATGRVITGQPATATTATAPAPAQPYGPGTHAPGTVGMGATPGSYPATQ